MTTSAEYFDHLMEQYRLSHTAARELVASAILARGRLLTVCAGLDGPEWTAAMQTLRDELHGAIEAAYEAAQAERTRRLTRTDDLERELSHR